MEGIAAFIVPALAGIVVGLFSGMLGIGGGTVLVPLFRLLFGMSPVVATATSLFTIIPTSLSGALSHARGKTCVVSLGVAMGLGGALTSPVGVWLATISPGWTIMLAASLVIGYSACSMISKALKMPAKGEAALQHDGSCENVNQPVVTRSQLVHGFFIGLGAGLVSGYVGVGGGFLMVPLMLTLLNFPMRYASGTSLIAVILLALPGVVEQGVLGNVDYLAGIAIALGSIPGAIAGSRLVRRVPERSLRLLFGGFLLVAAAALVLNELGVSGQVLYFLG